MTEKQYKLNHGLIARDEDCSLFDPVAFKIYKFNEIGYKMLFEVVEKKALTLASKEVTSEGQLREFLKKCELNNILLAVE